MRHVVMPIAAVVAVMLAVVAAPVAASVSVLGTGYARSCFDAAETRHATREGLWFCDKALADASLSIVDRAATWVNRGIVEMQRKHLPEAIANYDEAIRLRPETAEAYVNKGIALLHIGGRDAEAAAVLTQGLDRNPIRPEIAYYTRGVAQELLGNARAAYEDYSRAAQLAPGWAEPSEQLQRFQTVRQKSAAG